MQTVTGNDSGAQIRGKVNENVRRRFTPDVRSSLNASTTQLDTDELINISATSASRTLTLLPVASANALYVVVVAADATNTVVFDGNASEQIEGASTKVITAAGKFLLIPNGSAWTCMVLT